MSRRAPAAIAETEAGRAEATVAGLKARIAELDAELRARAGELTRRESAIRDSEERHALVVQAVAEGVYEWDIEKNSLSPSARLVEIFGFHGRELGAGDWNALIHPDDFPRYRAALRDCFRGVAARLDCEYRVRHNDGAYRWIEDRAVPVRSEAGRAVRLVGAVTDVTERRATEQALRDNEERYSLVSQAVAEGIYDWNVEGNTLFVSPRLIEIFKFEGTGLSSENWFGLVHADDRERYRGALRSCFKGETPRVACEYRILVRSGEYRWVEDHGLPIRNAAGRAIRLVGAVSDITERKEGERALREALEQQTATTEVLQVINSSPGDLAPVFDAMLDKTMTLCGAAFGVLLTYDGTTFRTGATRGLPPRFAEYLATTSDQPGPGAASPRLVRGERVVHILDLKDDEPYRSGNPYRRALVEIGGARTLLALPLRRDNAVLGTLNVYRQEVRPFSEKQIALLENFAAQAVIAMENARLLGELRQRTGDLQESLEYQTATSDVLKVISRSTFDLQPVLDTVVETAVRLCAADGAGLSLREGEQYRYVAVSADVENEYFNFLRQRTFAADRGTITGRVGLEGKVVHVADIAADPEYAMPESMAIGRLRTLLGVPLLRDGTVIGAINLARYRVEPFTDRQIELVRTFADQAVIAIENARLITETQEALEQQTATAEVLQVINSSPGDLAPVFDSMLEKATRLCEGVQGVLWTYDGERFRPAAMFGVPEEFADFLRKAKAEPPGPDTYFERIARGERLVETHDLADDPNYLAGVPGLRAAVEIGGIRTRVAVALVKDEVLLGVFAISHREVRPFSDKQIALLQSFAAQAVIAMENARLLGELQQRTGDLQESLEYQTATSDVLKVISQSDAELASTLDTLVATATRLCLAEAGNIFLRDGEVLRLMASFGVPEEGRAYLEAHPNPLDRHTASGRAVVTGQTIQIADITADPEFTHAATIAIGVRTMLGVPLLREGVPIGSISLARHTVMPFTDKQVALVSTFADQAVIAIENARLLGALRERTGDLQESLEYQTATSDVLKVISRSTFDLQPVLETVAETAARLCDADMVIVHRRDGEVYRLAASLGFPPEFSAFRATHPITPTRGSITGRVALEGRVIHIADCAIDPEYAGREAVEMGKQRTVLGVPLLRQNAPIGIIVLARTRVEPFTERQIDLVRTFADQAVIAIENTRLLTETREALEQQTATAEVLQVINSSPGDLAPVFDAVLDKALHLCGAAFGDLYTYDGVRFHTAAVKGASPEYAELRAKSPPNPSVPGTVSARILKSRASLHVLDLQAEETYQTAIPSRRVLVDIGGARSLLAVPLLKDDAVFGYITIYRREVGAFSDKQTALLQNFAAQAVIAIDNARLLDEIRQRQAELRVTFDNMGDGVVMFDAEMRLAAWNHNFQEILELPEALLAQRPTFAEYFDYLAKRGEYGSGDLEAELRRAVADTALESRFERERPDGRVIEVRRNAVPGGGAVLIYSDVTERKRSEEAIRAARDTAEAALRNLKTAQASLVQAEKMASLGQLTAGIAHEIKNPLNFVNNFAGLSIELLKELKAVAAPAIAGLDGDARAEVDETVEMLTSNLEKIGEHGRRADGIVKSMLEHSRGGTGDRRSIDLNGLIEEALNLAYHGARAQDQNFNITLERDFAAAIAPIELVPQDVTRVFLNLVGNGFYAANKRRQAAGNGFRPVLKVTTRELGDAVEIVVRDNGTGITPEVRDKLFQPFFTTKPTGEGTGLGLSISYDIVTQQHGGTITVDSRLGEFTEFTVRLPRAGAGLAVPSPAHSPILPRSPGRQGGGQAGGD